jgi:hypothetical protein
MSNWAKTIPQESGYYWLRYLGETLLVKLDYAPSIEKPSERIAYIYWTGYDEGPDIEMIEARGGEWYQEPIYPPQ